MLSNAFSRATTLSFLGFSALVSASSCIESPSGPPQRTAQGAPAKDAQGDDATATAAPRFVGAEPGEVVAVVQRAVATARADGCTLVVYVGASWCEPCQAFHHAVEEGRLDAALSGIRFLEFDADVDGERLDAAGYSGRYIPRFVVPTDEGRPSAHAVEGGIKGDGAVEHIMKRLEPVLARAAQLRAQLR